MLITSIGLGGHSARRSIIALESSCSPAVIRSLSIMEEREISELDDEQEANPLLSPIPLSNACEKDSCILEGC